MLVGSLPFYDEDPYTTRAKICRVEYGWPELDHKWPSTHAKALVGNILVEAQDRFSTEQIIDHHFFTEKSVLGDLYPPLSKGGYPGACQGGERDQALRKQYCRSAGVGKDENGQPWACVGFGECSDPIGNGREGALITLPLF